MIDSAKVNDKKYILRNMVIWEICSNKSFLVFPVCFLMILKLFVIYSIDNVFLQYVSNSRLRPGTYIAVSCSAWIIIIGLKY